MKYMYVLKLPARVRFGLYSLVVLFCASLVLFFLGRFVPGQFFNIFYTNNSPTPIFRQGLFNRNQANITFENGGMQARLIAQPDAAVFRVQRHQSQLDIQMPLTKPTIQTTEEMVTFESENKAIAVEYTALPNGVKEDIVLYAEAHTNLFPSRVVAKNAIPTKNPDRTITFHSPDGEYQFHFEAPYAVDALGNTTYGVQYYLVDAESVADSELAGVSVDLLTPMIDLINQDLLMQKQVSPGKYRVDVFNNLSTENDTGGTLLSNMLPTALMGTQNEYMLVVQVDENWLFSPERVYPIRIDPTVVHDTNAIFATGSFLRSGSASSGINTPNIQTSTLYQYSDPHTLGYWNFNESSGGTVFDYSGNENHGTAVGTSATHSKAGFGFARSLNGTSNSITLPVRPRLNSFTIEGWFYRERMNLNEVILDNGWWTSSQNILIYIYDSTGTWGAPNSLGGGVRNGSTVHQFSSSTIPVLNEWNHFAMVADGVHLTLYLNGEQVAQMASNLAVNSSNDFVVGKRQNASTNYFQGKVDDFRISSKPRSAEEIKRMYELHPYAMYTSPVMDLGADTIVDLSTLSWDTAPILVANENEPISDQNLVAQWDFDTVSGSDLRSSSASPDALITKMGPHKEYGWSRIFGQGSSYDGIWSAVVGGDGLFSAGYFYNTVNFDDTGGTDERTTPAIGHNIFITRYNLDGSYGWTRAIGADGNDSGLAIASDATAVYTGGFFTYTVNFDDTGGTDNKTYSGTQDAFITKYYHDGSYGWTRAFGGTGLDRVVAVAVNDDGDVFATGFFHDTVNFDDTGGTDERSSNSTIQNAFITKYYSDGSYGWTRVIGGGGSEFAQGSGVALDADGNVYVSGHFTGSNVNFDDTGGTDLKSTTGGADVFLTRYNSDGSYGWTRTFGGSWINEGIDVKVSESGEVYVGGRFTNTVNFDDTGGTDNRTSNAGAGPNAFITKYYSDGSYGWTRAFGGTTAERIQSLVLDSEGSIFAIGYMQSSSVDFDDTSGSDVQSLIGSATLFVTKYYSDGSYGWTQLVGEGTSFTQGYGLAIDNDDWLYPVGVASGTDINFDFTQGAVAQVSAGSCKYRCNGNLIDFDDTTAQDVVAGSGWSATHKKWGEGALMFDGVDNYVTVPNPTGLPIAGNPRTIEAWYKPDTNNPGGIIMHYGDGTGGGQEFIFAANYVSGTPYIFSDGVNSGNNIAVSSSELPAPGKWNHMVFVLHSPTQWSYYLNGALLKSGVFPVAINTAAPNILNIGHRTDIPQTKLNGTLDTTRLYSRALSHSEIIAQYRATSAQYGKLQFQTRTSPDGSTWEEWRPTGNPATVTLQNWSRSDTEKVLTTSTLPKVTGSTSQFFSTYQKTAPTGYVASWSFDETGGTGAFLKDSSGNGHHGTPINVDTVVGISKQAASFNGSNSVVTIGNTLQPSLPVTISMWIKPNALTSYAGLFTTDRYLTSNHNHSGIFFEVDANGSVRINYGNNTACGQTGRRTKVSPASVIQVGKWAHVVGVIRDATDMDIYVNGVDVGGTYEGSGGALVHVGGSRQGSIGAIRGCDSGSFSRFNGVIDDVKVSDVSRSLSYVQAEYKMSKNQYISAEAQSVSISETDIFSFDIAADRPGTYLQYQIKSDDLVAVNATGGDSVYTITDGGKEYRVHEFTTVGNAFLELESNIGEIEIEYLIVGGGGGGGETIGGGGGGGGVLLGDGTFFRNETSLPVIVGDGGAGGWGAGYPPGVKGGDSSFGDIVAIGGGAGAGYNVAASGVGGSAGGNGGGGGARAGFTVGQGNDGGGHWGNNAGGGGGGAGQSGTSGSASSGGNGGNGIQSSITGTATYYAGGGGGGTRNSTGPNPGNGGLGGGGDGGRTTAGDPGTPNTGGGGGGGGYVSDLAGGDGGSGIVIIRYETMQRPTIAQGTITVDFSAKLDAVNAIEDSNDTSFMIDATSFGLPRKGAGILAGEKIIIRENYDGVEYLAQATVASVNESTGLVTVQPWDSGSTFPSGGFTEHADVFKWQKIFTQLHESASLIGGDIDLDFTLHITDGNEGRSVWLDNFLITGEWLTDSSGSSINSTPDRYFQYRVLFTTTHPFVSSGITAISLDYSVNYAPSAPTLDYPGQLATDVSLLPTFVTTAEDTENDYIRYRIILCQDSAMTSNCQTFDQTVSQVGWSGQNSQSGTAYTSGTAGEFTPDSPLNPNTTYYWKSQAIDPGGSGKWSALQASPGAFTTSTNTPPSAPTNLRVNGQVNPTNLTTTTPYFTAVYNDPDPLDQAISFQIQVSKNQNFGNLYATWTGVISPAIDVGDTSPQITYNGQPLAFDGSVYYWRIRFVDNWGAAGAWSSSGPGFSMGYLEQSNQCVARLSNDAESIQVFWIDNSTIEDGYELQRNVNDGGWTALSSEPADTVSYVDSAITLGNTYQYRVRANMGATNGDWCTTGLLTPNVGSMQMEALQIEGMQFH